MSATSRRPSGVTFVAAALFFFFLSAIGNLLVWRSIDPTLFPPGSPEAGVVRALTGPLFDSTVSFYGITALAAAIATWCMLSWMAVAFLSWSVAALLLGAFFLKAFAAMEVMPAAIAFVAGLAVFTPVVWMTYRYLRRIAPNAANAAF